MTFEPGTIVHVRSGGPQLTVLSVTDDSATCLFFSDELGEFKEATLPLIALEPSELDDEEEEEAEDDEAEEASEGDDTEEDAAEDEDEDEDDEESDEADD